MVKVIVITRYARIERIAKNKAEAIQLKNEIEESRVIMSYSITEITEEKIETLPVGYQ